MIKCRFPKDFKFVDKKNYSVKVKKTEYLFFYEKDLELYRKEMYVNKKQKSICYIAYNDLKNHLNYLLSFDEKNSKILKI